MGRVTAWSMTLRAARVSTQPISKSGAPSCDRLSVRSLKKDGSADHFVPQNMLMRLTSTVALF